MWCTFILTKDCVQQYWAKADQAHSYITCQEMASVFAKTGMGEQSHAHLQRSFQETDQSNAVRLESNSIDLKMFAQSQQPGILVAQQGR